MKNFILKSIRARAEKLFSARIFDEQFLDIYLLTYVIRIAASLFSLLTGFYFLFTLFGAQIEGYMKYVLATLIVLIVESLKYYITPKAFSNIFRGKYGYGFPALMVGLPLYLVSVFFTVNGVEKYFEANNDAIEVAVQEKEEKVNDMVHYYDSLIAVEQKKYDELKSQHEGTRRMGWIAIIEQFNRIEDRIDSYRQERNKALEETKEEETDEVAVITEETNFLKSNTIYISIASESLLFLAFLFSQFYLYRAYKDLNIKKKTGIKISIPKLGTLTLPKKQAPTTPLKKGKREEQVQELVDQGITDKHEIAQKIGSHPNYVQKILKKIGA